jgi:hypothetical protein
MRVLLFISALLFAVRIYAQDKQIDNYVKTIEKLRKEESLTKKAYPGKTFVGSLTWYTYNDSLVLINSLTDAETTGTETQYYIKDGQLQKVFNMSAWLASNNNWKEYYSKHLNNDNCPSCHLNEMCTITIISFLSDPEVTVMRGNKTNSITDNEKHEIVDSVKRTYMELRDFLKTL